ncbi:MAG: EamA family transporter [Gammaproteobacteria bacterium]|nr:EamA family transporter [Gammaproteobacteria bacterium]NND59275.1 EamA family transporter [Gammaproteobacteria bacterium]
MKPGLQKLQLIAAFAVVYLVWGSTYLGIRIAVQDLPPGLLAGVRFIAAGLIILVVALLLGQRWPRRRDEWGLILLMGFMMIFVGNGFVTWAEQWVESNQAALLIASSAFWTAWFGTFGRKGHALTTRVKLGLVTGFVGVAFILAPQGGFDLQYFWAQMAILVAPITWSAASMYSRSKDLTTPPMMMAAWQMLAGGVMLLVAGLLAGETSRVQFTLPALLALAYLTVFGSCLAYATYIWLINKTTPDRLATIAYVNPAVATVLGWWILDEVLGPLQFLGMLIILVSVIVVTGTGWRRGPLRTGP